MQKYSFKLFVTAASSAVEDAARQVKGICKEHGVEDCQLEVVVIAEDPDAAEQYGILATPTLMKLEPAPVRRVIGDLSDPTKLARGLDFAKSSQ